MSSDPEFGAVSADPGFRDRIEGGLIGLLIGDALGVPYEFHPPQDLPTAAQIEFRPPQGFRRAHVGVPPGTWSDDGAHALVLLDSLLTKNCLDLTHLSAGLVRWLFEGFCAVNRSVFDVGAQTSTAINRLNMGVSPEHSGPTDERHNGNGSLMRVLPLALWHRGTVEELALLAARHSLPTHGHPRSQVACAMYCLWARATLGDADEPWGTASSQLRALAASADFFPDEVELMLNPANADAARGTGYVVDTLWSARAAVENSKSYEECVRRAILYGHDTDTTAAVAGGIAGLKYGKDGIPERWRIQLRGESIYLPLLDRLLAYSAH